MPKSDTRLRQLVELHFDHVWRSLRGFGVDTSSVDDAAQQVFLIASRKLAHIERGRERAFLFATARGVASNIRRSRARRQEVADDALFDLIDSSPDLEQALSITQGRQLLEQILDSMDDSLRVVFVLFELEDMTTADISAAVGLPMGTVASRLRRAREHFHREVQNLQRRKR